MAWKRFGGAQWRYCAKVGLAAGLGYLLARGGDNEYAVYSVFTAALIVGASVGEDLATSANRVKGTLAGMIAGLALSMFVGPSAMTVGLAVTGTALIALAVGWGVPVARIGVTVCVITLVHYGQSALEYDLLRGLNTVIGVVVGLAVSFFVWPTRARDSIDRLTDATLAAGNRLLDAIAAGEPELRPAELKLWDAIGALVKAGGDAKLEREVKLHTHDPDPRPLRVLQFAFEVLAAALAAEGHAPASPTLDVLRTRLAELART
jgi:uncharacterized membrane protein YccC